MASLILLAIGSIIAWGACGFVLVKFDPFVGDWTTQTLFYASLGMALLGTLILVRLLWHHRRTGMAASRSETGVFTRQSFLFTVFVIVILNLAAAGLLKWWNLMPLALLTLTTELLFASLIKQRRRINNKN